MTEQKYIKWLSIVVLFLVSTVTLISFVLSYEALWRFALDGGKPWLLAFLWPVIIDLPIVVFSLVALFAVVLGYSPWPFRGLVLLATLGTVWFNYSYALSGGLSWEVYITAPIMYFTSFEVLVWLIKIVSGRSVIITKIAEISAKLKVLEIEYRGKKDNLAAELDRLERERMAEIETQANQMSQQAEANRLRLTEEIGQLESQQASLNEAIEVKAKTLASYNQDIEAKREELKSLDSGQSKIYVPANLTIEQRQELVNRLTIEGMTNEAIAATLGCSIGTVKNDKKAIKTLEEVAGESGFGRNGHKRG